MKENLRRKLLGRPHRRRGPRRLTPEERVRRRGLQYLRQDTIQTVLSGGEEGRDLMSRTAHLQKSIELLKEITPALSSVGTKHQENVDTLRQEISAISRGSNSDPQTPFSDKRAIWGKPEGDKKYVGWWELLG